MADSDGRARPAGRLSASVPAAARSVARPRTAVGAHPRPHVSNLTAGSPHS